MQRFIIIWFVLKFLELIVILRFIQDVHLIDSFLRVLFCLVIRLLLLAFVVRRYLHLILHKLPGVEIGHL